MTRKDARLLAVSPRGVGFIADHEGLRLTAYKPVAAERFWTIGYGHYGVDVRPGQTISAARARVLLRRDIKEKAADHVRRLVKVKLTQGEFDALVSLCFNIGPGNFERSSVLRELNKGHRYRAGLAFLMWVNGADGRRLLGLVKRRKAEREMFRGK